MNTLHLQQTVYHNDRFGFKLFSCKDFLDLGYHIISIFRMDAHSMHFSPVPL